MKESMVKMKSTNNMDSSKKESKDSPSLEERKDECGDLSDFSEEHG